MSIWKNRIGSHNRKKTTLHLTELEQN